VVGVEDDWDAVGRSDTADVVGTSNATGNGSFLVAIGDALYNLVSAYKPGSHFIEC
jgi:hypothetical protein